MTDSMEGRAVLASIVLAAGSGSRFEAGNKLLAHVAGRPLIDHAVDAVKSASSVDVVGVVISRRADDLRAHLVDRTDAELVVAVDAEEGLAASLRAGVGYFAGADAVVVTLADQPLVSTESIDRVVAARAPGVEAVRASYQGLPNHPTLIERSLFAQMRQLRGDRGAAALLETVPTALIACDDCADPSDVDSIADLRSVEQRAV